MREILPGESLPQAISEHDILEAMKSLQGYIDITPGDFREVFRLAYGLARERLLTTLTAERIMTATVVVVEQDMPLVKAAGLLAEKHITGAPVVNQAGGIVGVVSEKDFLREMGFTAAPSFMQIATHCLHDKSCMIGRLHNRTVGEIMASPAITGSPDLTLSGIAALFSRYEINRLPIVDTGNRPVGIVTRTDLSHGLHLLAGEEKS